MGIVPLFLLALFGGTFASPLLKIRQQDTITTPRPLLGSVPYGVDIRTCNTPGRVALTFDDGPYIYTSTLLDLLAANGNVKATFFIVGNNFGTPIDDPASGYIPLLQRMHREGHQLGSHTWTHADLSTVTAAEREEQITRNEEAFASIFGWFPTYLRPPYTDCTAECLAALGELGYHVANYNVDTKDYQGDYTFARQVFDTNVVTGGSPSQGSSWIVLSHDIHEETVNSLAQYMIDGAREQGYELVTMGECLGDPRSNWYRDSTTGQSWSG